MLLGIGSSCYALRLTGSQDQDCERSAWQAEKAGWKIRLCFQRLGFEPQPRECSLHQIDYFEY